jgi:hypothetical protein
MQLFIGLLSLEKKLVLLSIYFVPFYLGVMEMRLIFSFFPAFSVVGKWWNPVGHTLCMNE